MSDFVKVTVEIQANGAHSTYNQTYALFAGKHIAVEAAKAAADCSARAAILHSIDPRDR